MKSFVFSAFVLLLLVLILAACNQDPTIEGRWVYERIDSGNLSPAQTYEFLDGNLSQGCQPKCFTNLELIGKYSYAGSMLKVQSDKGLSMQLVMLTDNEAVFDIQDSTNTMGRVVYCRP